jgi:hypothetical protein
VISDASLAALLEGAEPAAGAEPQLGPLAKALADLTDRPADDELGGEAETLAAFRNQVSAPGPAHRPHQRRRQLLPRSLPARIAVAAGAVALSLGGLTTAAYARALPAPVQRLAHDIIGAPAPRSQPAGRPYPAGPAAAHSRTGPSGRTHPAPDSDGHGKPSGHPTPHGHGKPGAHPAPQGGGKPGAHPAPRGHGKPSAHPAPRGHGKPRAHPAPHGHGKLS